MANTTARKLLEWEKSRDISEETLQGIKDIKKAKSERRFTKDTFPLVRAREKAGLSQSEFAALLGVSVRTLQDLEQGRREPSSAAKTLFKVAERYPEVLREVAA